MYTDEEYAGETDDIYRWMQMKMMIQFNNICILLLQSKYIQSLNGPKIAAVYLQGYNLQVRYGVDSLWMKLPR